MAYPALLDEWSKDIELTRTVEQTPLTFEGLEDVEDAARHTGTEFKDKNNEIFLDRTSSSTNKHLDDQFQEEDKKNTLLFEDGIRKIDYVLTYTAAGNEHDKIGDDDNCDNKRTMKRKLFLNSFEEHGLEYEIQDCSKSFDQVTYFVKVHAKWEALLEGAERLNLRMPVEESKLREVTWRERFFDFIHMRDPLVPDIDFKHKIKHNLTAPFRKESKLSFLGIEDDELFFTSAQRSAIVFDILEHIHYGKEPLQVGITRLLSSNTFSKAFPLHDGPYYCKSADDIKNDRQLLYYHWSKWTNFYKSQPLNHVRKYFGEKVGIYFTWVGFYTEWLIYASFVGFVVMLYGFSTIPIHRNALADDICNTPREHFFMCPLCDERCDFWYYRDTCNAAHVLFLFDNGGTVFFAAFMSLWAVLFLEFWKRRQFVLQHDWDVLGYEKIEECPRPEFEHKIKGRIIKLECKGKDPNKYKQYNQIYEKDELVQPSVEYLSKIGVAFSILCSLVLIVIGIVFAVLMYRLVVAGTLYRRVQNFNGGPSAVDFIVLITGSVIQLIAILIMSKIYVFFADRLTKWELHRTQSEFDDNFIAKMYVFQFVNFYSSIFYIAFFKGNFTGYPGNYYRIGSFRLDECSTYGCLLELTIQLSVVMLGKQMINNFIELGVPFLKWFIAWYGQRKQISSRDIFRWEKDFELPPISSHGLFDEYLELVIQFGFITIFVAAFPLAPLFALLNNIVEIRLDAFKFVTVLRRPVAERAQDIGTWYTILNIVTKLAVFTNAFLIAVTAQFIPLLVYRYHDPNPELRMNSPAYINNNVQKHFSGYVEYSLTKFPISLLIEDDKNPFPLASAIALKFYNGSDEPTAYFYQPYHTSVDCFTNTSRFGAFNLTNDDFPFVILDNNQSRVERRPYFSENLWNKFTSLYKIDPGQQDHDKYLECVNQDFVCSFRGLATENGRYRRFYYVTWTSRLAFVVCFEHVIFVVSAFLAFLVPDVPASVQDEIKKENLLASEALHNRTKN